MGSCSWPADNQFAHHVQHFTWVAPAAGLFDAQIELELLAASCSVFHIAPLGSHDRHELIWEVDQ
jgi:hypothetical protein